MAIVNGTALESNKNFRVSFDGGNLSSDGGLSGQFDKKRSTGEKRKPVHLIMDGACEQ